MKYRYRLERSRIVPGTGTYKLFEVLEKDVQARSTLTLPALDLETLLELSLVVSSWADKTVLKRAIVPPRRAVPRIGETCEEPAPRFTTVGESANCAHPYHEIEDHPQGVNCPTCGEHD